MRSVDLHNYLRDWALILFGLIALVIAPFKGSLEAAGFGALSLLVGSGLLAFSIWERRNPVPPSPMRLWRRRSHRSK